MRAFLRAFDTACRSAIAILLWLALAIEAIGVECRDDCGAGAGRSAS